MRLRSTYIIMAAYWLAFISMGASGLAQSKPVDSTATVCDKEYREILAQYDSGHYATMDLLFERFQKGPCTADFASYRGVLFIVKKQRLEDRFRINEAVALQKILDTLQNNNGGKKNQKGSHSGQTPNYYQWRMGITGSGSLTNIGKAAWTYGAQIGRHFKPGGDGYGEYEWGIDLGAFYQKLPFGFNVIQNKDGNNNYSPGGFVLAANGSIESYGFTLLASYDLFTADRDGMGFGLFGGGELMHIESVRINGFYHEYNYSDSIIQPGNINYIKYASERNSNYRDDDFFKGKTSVNLVFGMNLSWKLGKPVLINVSPQYTLNSFSKLSISKIDYATRVHEFGLKVSIFYLIF